MQLHLAGLVTVAILLQIPVPRQTPYRPYSILAPPPLPEQVEMSQRGREFMQEGWSVTPAKAAELEAQLVHDPENLPVRLRFVSYYYQQILPAGRDRHLLWLIENHPEAEILRGRMVGPPESSMNPSGEYARMQSLWRLQVSRFPGNARVVENAVVNVDPETGIQMLEAAWAADPKNGDWTRWLAKNYADAIRWTFWDGKSMMTFTGDPEDYRHPPFFLPLPACQRVKGNAERSMDGPLLEAIGESLVRQVRLLRERQAAGGGDLLTPEVQQVSDYGERLRDRGRTLVKR